MQPARASRRQLLRTAGAAIGGSLAGCTAGDPTGDEPSATASPAAPGTDTPSPTAAPSGPPPPTADDVALDVAVLQSFTPDQPARLEIAFTNAGERSLLGLGGPQYVLPFVDDDYAGEAADGSLALFLLPDDNGLAVEPEGEPTASVESYLPDAPTDGCWTVPFEWPAAKASFTAVLHEVPVEPGGTVSHEYSLYYLDDCVTGTFAFESSFDLGYRRSDDPDGTLYPTALGFDLTIADDGITVSAHEPAVDTPDY